MKIAMVKHPVIDAMAAHKFYVEVLGFSSYMHVPAVQLAVVTSPDETGLRLMLEPRDRHEATGYFDRLKAAGEFSLVLTTPDIEAELTRLREKGVTIVLGPDETDFGIQAIFDDTCGNLVQIYQPRKSRPVLKVD